MKNILKFATICFFGLLASLVQLHAQSYPQWDVAPDMNSNGNGPAAGRSVGQGQSVYIITSPAEGYSFIYQWSIAGGWQVLCEVNGYDTNDTAYGISTLAIQGNYLYIAGYFSSLQNASDNTTIATAHDIAKYNLSTGQWSAVGSDDLPLSIVSNGAESMTVDNSGDIYLGLLGPGSQMLWEWNRTNWITVGQGFVGNDDGDVGVLALTTDGTNVFAAGGFTAATNDDGSVVQSDVIIKWNGTQFQSINVPFIGPDLEFTIYGFSLAVTGTNVFMSGNFQYAMGGTTNSGLVRFSSVNGGLLPCPNLYQVNPGVYEGYQLGSGFSGGMVTQNGNIYLAGNFSYIGYDTNSTLAANCIAMWTNNGSADGMWTNLSSGLTSVAGEWYGYLAADENAVFVSAPMGGYQFYAGGVPIPLNPPIARWMTAPDNFYADPSFSASTDGTIYDAAIDINGNILIAGNFTHVNGQARAGIARLTPSGALDTSFDASDAVNTYLGSPDCVGSDSLGRVYIGGNGFLRVDNSGNMVNTEYTYMNGFFISCGEDGFVATIAGGGQPIPINTNASENTVEIGGSFNIIGDRTNICLADIWVSTPTALTPDGLVDSEYQSLQADFGCTVEAMAGAPGSFNVGGDLETVAGDTEVGFAGYDPSESLAFNGGADSYVWALALQPNGKLVVGGDFEALGTDIWYTEGAGSAHSHLGRFNADGTVDNTFNPSLDITGDVQSLLLQSDGSITAAGGNVEECYSDGTTNPYSLIPVSGTVYRMVQVSTNQIIAVGDFTAAGGLSCTNIFRFIRTH